MASTTRKAIATLTLGALLASTAGCTEFWTSTVTRKNNIQSGDVLLTTADLRQTTRTRSAGAVITCAEPSPDVAKIAAAAMDTSASGSAQSVGNAVSPELALSLAASRSEALAQLGQRLATVQLLRDGMFRACEAFANGAIDSTAYSSILSRYDKLMITMLLGEFAANSTTRVMPVTLTSNSESHGSANATAPAPAASGAAAGAPAAAAPAEGSGGTADASSEAQSATQAPTVTVVQAQSDGTGVAAALATMQQTYIDDVNVDPLILNCLSTKSGSDLAGICANMVNNTSFLSAIVGGKLMATLLRANGDQTMTLEQKTAAIEALKKALDNFTETVAKKPQ